MLQIVFALLLLWHFQCITLTMLSAIKTQTRLKNWIRFWHKWNKLLDFFHLFRNDFSVITFTLVFRFTSSHRESKYCNLRFSSYWKSVFEQDYAQSVLQVLDILYYISGYVGCYENWKKIYMKGNFICCFFSLQKYSFLFLI